VRVSLTVITAVGTCAGALFRWWWSRESGFGSLIVDHRPGTELLAVGALGLFRRDSRAVVHQLEQRTSSINWSRDWGRTSSTASPANLHSTLESARSRASAHLGMNVIESLSLPS
jgi:hypothetical protein